MVSGEQGLSGLLFRETISEWLFTHSIEASRAVQTGCSLSGVTMDLEMV